MGTVGEVETRRARAARRRLLVATVLACGVVSAGCAPGGAAGPDAVPQPTTSSVTTGGTPASSPTPPPPTPPPPTPPPPGATDGLPASAVSRLADVDTDGDGLLDPSDNCAGTSNPRQDDRDRDGLGDACELGSPGRLARVELPAQLVVASGGEVVVAGAGEPGATILVSGTVGSCEDPVGRDGRFSCAVQVAPGVRSVDVVQELDGFAASRPARVALRR